MFCECGIVFSILVQSLIVNAKKRFFPARNRSLIIQQSREKNKGKIYILLCTKINILIYVSCRNLTIS